MDISKCRLSYNLQIIQIIKIPHPSATGFGMTNILDCNYLFKQTPCSKTLNIDTETQLLHKCIFVGDRLKLVAELLAV